MYVFIICEVHRHLRVTAWRMLPLKKLQPSLPKYAHRPMSSSVILSNLFSQSLTTPIFGLVAPSIFSLSFRSKVRNCIMPIQFRKFEFAPAVSVTRLRQSPRLVTRSCFPAIISWLRLHQLSYEFAFQRHRSIYSECSTY